MIGARNFTLGQNYDSVVGRLRTNVNALSGFGRGNGIESLTSVTNINLNLQHVVWTFDGHTNAIWIDGMLDSTQTLPGGISNWDPMHKFAIGDELIDERQWIGTIYYAAIYSRKLSDAEIEHHEKLGSEPNPVLAQNTEAVKFQDCDIWPFDILTIDSFDLFEQTMCSETEGSIFVTGDSRSKLSTLTNLVSLQGDLVLDGIPESNLDALSNLKTIGGDLIISNNESLTNFLGLSNLESIGGDLIIKNNRRIRGTDGFGKITNLYHHLVVANNSRLASVSGFNNLLTAGTISIDRNPVLANLRFDSLELADRLSIAYGGVDTLTFPALVGVEEFYLRSSDFITELINFPADKYFIYGNDSLRTISQLPTNATTEISISSNPRIENLDNLTGNQVRTIRIRTSNLTRLGLNNLERVFGNLSLFNLNDLTSMDNEFLALEKVDGTLEIDLNRNLVTMTNAFPVLDDIDSLDITRNYLLSKVSDSFPTLSTVDDLEVTFNSVLPDCDIDLFTDNFTVAGSSVIVSNDETGVCP